MKLHPRQVLRPASALLPVLALVCMAGGALHGSLTPVQAASDPAQPAFYTEKVLPIFQSNCYRCHGGMNRRGGLNMETRDSMLKGGHHGSDLTPGHPESSLIVRLIRHEGPADDPMNMPPAPRPKLSDADISTVEAWIRAGAVMPPPTQN